MRGYLRRRQANHMQQCNTNDRLSIVKAKQIASTRAKLVSRYPAIWSSMIDMWNASGEGDFAWLMYSSNYLFRTGGVRWAIDPMTLNNRVSEAPVIDIARDLQGLSVVLLTHEHADHLDLNLLRRLREFCLHWVIPQELLGFALEEGLLQRDCIIVPTPFEPIDLCGLRITPFPGFHWDLSSFPAKPGNLARGVPSTGYLVEMAQKRWLFPGDTRTYDARMVRGFGPVDAVFAHLWLGRGCALMASPPLLDAFNRFFVAMQPRKIVITHLEEFGRSVEDYWTRGHAKLVSRSLRQLAPLIDVVVPHLGEAILI
jgi:L-ascorbate metabolism protein UlaG (beta-lactamase superfamily)